MFELKDVGWVASRLGEPVVRVYELCRRGMLPHVRLGRRIKFDVDEVEKWITEGGASLESSSGPFEGVAQ